MENLINLAHKSESNTEINAPLFILTIFAAIYTVEHV